MILASEATSVDVKNKMAGGGPTIANEDLS
jgi:hypothetical protein